MARCDSGYFCLECGEYVPSILESELYLRYVMGEVPFDGLLALPDRHIRCNPAIAQYIVHESFPAVLDERPEFDKRRRDPAEVVAREDLVTRAWLRQQSLPESGLDVADYPLPGVASPPVEDYFGPAEDDPEGRIFQE